MTATLEVNCGRVAQEVIVEHLRATDAQFSPPLSARLDLGDYSAKLADAATIAGAWRGDVLVGMVAGYCNDSSLRQAFVSNVSVMAEWTGMGIAERLLRVFIAHVDRLGFREIALQVARTNTVAMRLYLKCGFQEFESDDSSVMMTHRLGTGD